MEPVIEQSQEQQPEQQSEKTFTDTLLDYEDSQHTTRSRADAPSAEPVESEEKSRREEFLEAIRERIPILIHRRL